MSFTEDFLKSLNGNKANNADGTTPSAKQADSGSAKTDRFTQEFMNALNSGSSRNFGNSGKKQPLYSPESLNQKKKVEDTNRKYVRAKAIKTAIEKAEAAEKEYDDYIHSTEAASIISGKQVQELYNQYGIPFNSGYTSRKEEEWNAKGKALKKKAEQLRAIANQYQMEDLMDGIDSKAEQAEQEYQDYIHSEEYAAWQMGRQKAQENLNRFVAESGIPIGLPASYEKNEKEEELKRKASYYRNLANRKKDEELIQADMKELESWPEEDQQALKRYMTGRTVDFYDTMNVNQNGIRLGNAEREAAGLFQKYGKQRVDEIAESYSRVLSRQNALDTTQQAQNNAGKGFWSDVGQSIGSVGLNLMGSVNGVAGYANELAQSTGRFSTLDPYNMGNIASTYAGAVRGQIAENLEERYGAVGSTLYQAGMSALDNLARIATVGDVGSLALAATGSFSQAVSEYSKKGATPVEALTMGVISGGLEVLTEKVSLDRLLKDFGSGKKSGIKILKDMLIQGGIEVSEEEASLLGTILAEAVILQERSSFNQEIEELQVYGMTKEEAREKACWDVVEEAAQTAIQSFLSGGMMSGATSVYSNTLVRMQERAEQKQLKNTVQQAAKEIQNGQKSGSASVTVAEGITVAAEKVQQAERISKATGRQIEFYSKDGTEKGMENGYFRDGKIYVNSKSGNPIVQIISHEMTHSVEMAQSYKELSSLVLKQIVGKGGNIQKLRQEKADAYAKMGVVLQSQAEIDSEIVADYVANHLLTDEQSIVSLTTENPSLGKRILNWLDGLIAKLGNKNAQERVFLNQARTLYARALGQTASAGNAAVQNQTVNTEDSKKAPANNASAETENAGQDMDQLKAWADEAYRNGEISEEEYDGILDQYDQYNSQNGIDYMAKEEGRFKQEEGNKTKYSFAGINAKNADMDALRKAKEMQAAGVEDETIRQQTGWFRGTDGKWRWEIDDSGMKYDSSGDFRGATSAKWAVEDFESARDDLWGHADLDTLDKVRAYNRADIAGDVDTKQKLYDELIHGNYAYYFREYVETLNNANEMLGKPAGGTLQDYIDHPALFEAYPNLKDVALRFENLSGGLSGYFNGSQNEIVLSYDIIDSPEEVLIHEIQHAIQKAEGFTKGSSVEYWRKRQEGYNPVRKNDAKIEKAQKESESILNELPENVKEQFLQYAESVEMSEEDINLSRELARGPYAEKFEDFFMLQWEIDEWRKHNWERGAYDLYRNTAGEIEARDAESRRNLSPEQRRMMAPERGDLDTVFAEEGNLIPLSSRYDEGNTDIRYSISESEESGSEEQKKVEPEQKKHVELLRDTLPAKARDYLERTERSLLNRIAKNLSVPYHARRESLKPIVQQISDEFLKTGKVSDETVNSLFETAYEAGIVADREFYDTYKNVKDHLRTTKVTISQQDQADIADFKDFRSRAWGTLRIVNEGGLPVDTAYQELNDMAPNLFPESITHPADQLQRMFDVGQSIRISEQSLDAYYGKDSDFKEWAKNDFAESINGIISELRTVARYAEGKAEEQTQKQEITYDQAAELYDQLKKARREYQKVNAKNLLTQEDEIQVGRLLRGEILPEHVTGDNANGILNVYNAKKEYEAISKQLERYKKQIRAKNLQKADEYLATANTFVDKRTGIAYSRETMERNVRDIVKNDPEMADRIVAEYFEPVHVSEAKSTRFKTAYRERVRGMNLSTKVEKGNLVSEAHAVQLLGEATDNIRVLEDARGRMQIRDGKNITEWKAVVDNLWLENPGLDKGKIESAVKEFRKIYDELFQKMNRVRIENGYEPVNYRQGYFPHFQPGDGDGIIAYFGRSLGIDTNVDALPTTINGLTHTFKPGIQWFGNAQERLGFNTAYDAVEGFDKYIEGVSSVIFQTENIQKLRALATQIRYRTSDEGLRKQVDAVKEDTRLTDEEKQMKIKDIFEHGKYTLSNFVTELDEYTNLLANKKSKYDRTMESMIGRRGYTIMKNVESKVAANMIGGNISSALTNFIPLTQAWGRIGSTDMLKGMRDTAKAVLHKDMSIVGQSDFLTNRRGSDVLVQNWSEKLSNVLGTPMEAIDNIVSEAIVRARYYQNLRHGMSEAEAMHQADVFAASVMADRSKGAMPTLFESSNPLFKAFTQFQLEVNNQYSEIFKDIPREFRGESKMMLAMAFFKYFVAAWLFNQLEEKIKGRRSALDPIGIATDFAEDWKNVGFGEAGSNLVVNVAEGLPFASALSLVGVDIDGGRIPVSSAMPDLPALWDAATDKDMNKAQRAKTAKEELLKPVTYLLLPGGGNQIQKMWKGIDAYLKGGSYGLDKDGNQVLQYPVYTDDGGDSFWNLVKSMLFGKNATAEAQNWVDSGFNSLNKFQTVVYKDMLEANVKDRDAYTLIDRLRNVPRPDGDGGAEIQRRNQQEILLGSDISDEGKAIAFYGMVATDGEKDLMNKLTDAGADAGSVIKFVIDFKDADALHGTVRREAMRDTIIHSALTEEEKSVIVGEILGTDMETEAGNPTQYAKYLYARNEGMSTDQYMRMYSKDVNMDQYLKLIDGGISPDGATELAISMVDLEPEDGEDEVKWMQKCDVILNADIGKEDQVAALEAVSYESTGRKIRIGYENGLEPGTLVELKRMLPDFDEDGNGSYSQKEVTAAIEAMAGDETTLALIGATQSLSNTQKAVLWQLQTNAKDGKKNPYDAEVGKYIYDIVQERKEAAEQEKEQEKEENTNKENVKSDSTKKSGKGTFSDEVMRQLMGG